MNSHLGISSISGTLDEYIEKNIHPLMSQLTVKYAAWCTLPLTPVGRGILLKIIFLPKYLYFFYNTPLHIPKAFFRQLEGMLIPLFGLGSPPGWQNVYYTFPYQEVDWRSQTSLCTIGQPFLSQYGGGFQSPNRIWL